MRVHGDSMAPSLTPGELIVVREGAFDRREPRRGELVASRPAALSGRATVKRIRGLPSERVSIDGQAWCLGPEEFFLMSDCVRQGADSRAFGPVARRELIGPVWARLWPWTVFATATP
jgi:type IV secretory pathway protease TraF